MAIDKIDEKLVEQHMLKKKVESDPLIIIWEKTDVPFLLKVIGNKGLFMDSVILQFTSPFLGVAGEIITYMTGSFGWHVVDRQRKKVITRSKKELDVWVIEIEKLGAIK